MTQNALATAMGYKGVSARLSRTVKEMLDEGTLKREIVNGRVHLCANSAGEGME